MLAGSAVVLAISVIIGVAFSFDPGGHGLAARTEVGPSLITLALATGVAGAYSVTTAISEPLVGVMVAVALLLLFINVAGINLAGTVTFLLQGVRPQKWWEAKKSARAVRMAIVVWVLLIALLAGLIILRQTYG